MLRVNEFEGSSHFYGVKSVLNSYKNMSSIAVLKSSYNEFLVSCFLQRMPLLSFPGIIK